MIFKSIVELIPSSMHQCNWRRPTTRPSTRWQAAAAWARAARRSTAWRPRRSWPGSRRTTDATPRCSEWTSHDSWESRDYPLKSQMTPLITQILWKLSQNCFESYDSKENPIWQLLVPTMTLTCPFTNKGESPSGWQNLRWGRSILRPQLVQLLRWHRRLHGVVARIQSLEPLRRSCGPTEMPQAESQNIKSNLFFKHCDPRLADIMRFFGKIDGSSPLNKLKIWLDSYFLTHYLHYFTHSDIKKSFWPK